VGARSEEDGGEEGAHELRVVGRDLEGLAGLERQGEEEALE